MKQGTLNFDAPLSRASDPRSSAQAADFAVESGLRDSHEARIVARVREQPGETGDEIGQALGLTNVQVLRRTRALERKGLVRRGEQRASRVSGRMGVTWHPPERVMA